MNEYFSVKFGCFDMWNHCLKAVFSSHPQTALLSGNSLLFCRLQEGGISIVYKEEEAGRLSSSSPLELLAWRGYPGGIAQVLGSEMERRQSGFLCL